LLSGRGLCVGLITRPEESYRVWCFWVWSWVFDNEEDLAHWGLLSHGKKKIRKSYSHKINRIYGPIKPKFAKLWSLVKYVGKVFITVLFKIVTTSNFLHPSLGWA